MYSTSEECHRASELFLVPSPKHHPPPITYTHAYTHRLTRYSGLLCIDVRALGLEANIWGELPTQGRTSQTHDVSEIVSQGSNVIPRQIQRAVPPGRCIIVHYRLRPLPSSAWGPFPTGHKHPVTPASMSCRFWESPPVPGLGSIWPPSHGTHPTANRVRWSTREISRGACVPPCVARSITHLVIQAVGPRGGGPHRTRDGREHARCRSWACDARRNSGLVSRRTAFVVDQALVCL